MLLASSFSFFVRLKYASACSNCEKSQALMFSKVLQHHVRRYALQCIILTLLSRSGGSAGCRSLRKRAPKSPMTSQSRSRRRRSYVPRRRRVVVAIQTENASNRKIEIQNRRRVNDRLKFTSSVYDR